MQDIEEIFVRLLSQYPNAKSELLYGSNFQLLVATVLSAQATDVSVNKATSELFKVAKTPQDMLLIGEENLKNYIRTIGIYNVKARNIIKTCDILVKNHNGEVPNNREGLEALPGVGRKTANVVLNAAFGYPTIAVDTHIFRLSRRTGMAYGKTPFDVEKKLVEVIPKKFMKKAHYLLLLHARYVCKARRPSCNLCVINEFCAYEHKNMLLCHSRKQYISLNKRKR